MKRLKTFIFYYYFSSWTNAALTKWLTLANISIIIFIFFSIIFSLINRKNLFYFNKEDYFLIIVFVLQLFLSAFNLNTNSLNYFLASFYTFFFVYILLKSLIISNIKLENFLKYNFYAVLFVSVFGKLEFFSRVFFDIYIQSNIPRSMEANAEFNLIDAILIRTYAFSEEPTYLAWYLNTLGLIAIHYLIKFKKNIIFVVPIFIAYLTTFSAAGFALIFLSFFLYYVLNFKVINLIKMTFLVFSILLIFSLITGFDNLIIILEPLYNKISLSQNQSGDRFPEWVDAYNLFLENPITGKGIGFYSSNDLFSPMNYFLFVLVESGIFVLLFLMIFYAIKLIKIFKSDLPNKKILFIAVLSGVLHLLTQSLFYHPCLWILLIFTDYSLLELNKTPSKKEIYNFRNTSLKINN